MALRNKQVNNHPQNYKNELFELLKNMKIETNRTETMIKYYSRW